MLQYALWGIPLLILLILPRVLKSSWFKGFLGELTVNLANKFLLPSNEYYCLKNITLPTEDGTTQIDHIVISSFGVFVIETKNMSGWIFGTKEQANWVQKFPRKSFKFQNPVRQNYKHIKTLEAITAIEPSHTHSIIAFMGSAKIKTEVPKNVTQGLGYIKYIRSFDKPVLTGSQISFAVQEIQQQRLPDNLKTNRQHINHLKEKHSKQK